MGDRKIQSERYNLCRGFKRVNRIAVFIFILDVVPWGTFSASGWFWCPSFLMLKMKSISNTIHVHAYRNCKIDIDHEKVVYMFHKNLLHEHMS